MIGEIGTASVVAEVDGGTEESGLEGSDLPFYEYAVTGIGSLYSVASRLAADPGQAAELLREAIEAASEQWSARPSNQAPEVWLMKALRDRAVAWCLSGRLETRRPLDHDTAPLHIPEPPASPGWSGIDSLTYDHREVLVFSEIAGLAPRDLAMVLGTAVEDAGARVQMARRKLAEWAVGWY